MRTAAPTRAKEGTLLVCTRPAGLLAQRSGPRLQGSGVHTPAVLSSCPDMVLFPVEVSGEAQSMCSSSLTPHYTLNPKPQRAYGAGPPTLWPKEGCMQTSAHYFLCGMVQVEGP